MSAVPPVSRPRLDALLPSTASGDQRAADSTLVEHAFVALETALAEHTAALMALDRIEGAVIAAHGYPRVPLPNTGTPPTYAADAASIVRCLGPGPAARRLTTELRRRQAIFAQAARASGLDAAQAEEARAAAELSAATADLLLMPAEAYADLAIKLAVLIAAGEASADDALAFPWLHLRALHADLRQLDTAELNSHR